MQETNRNKNVMQDTNENCARKVNKKVTNKMSKNQKAASSTPDNYRESPQNARLDTSESDEESVSEILLACLCLRPDLLESFPRDQDEISTEDYAEEESCESDNDDPDEDVSDEDEDESSNQDNSDEDSEVTDEEHPSGPSKKFLLDVDSDLDQRHSQLTKQEKINAILEAAAATKKDKKGNPVLRSATAALGEAAQTITRMRSDASPRDKTLLSRTLIAACNDNDVNAVRRLLVEGSNLNDATDDGESLLSLACSAGYYELAQVLLAMSAQVEDRGQKNDCTPLMEAASAGHIEIIELLLGHGADVNAQSSTGNTPLMYACAGGHVEAVKTLLKNGANVEDHNENGHTPLMEAASAGHVEVAKILLENGAGINTHSNEFKESALTLACYKGHLDMVRFLLEAGADQEHKTDEMHTALMEASMDGHVEVARLLLDSGAQVNMPTDSFESPLTLAACGGHVDLAMLLIERGANIEEVNDEGYTPLMEAAREGHEEMVSLLLSQGANINAQTEETQETALTLACCGGFLEVADYLIKHGADIELGASTPLMEAAQEGHLDLVKFLLENKADVHAQTQTGDTALTYACENGHTDVAEVLLYYGAELEHLSEGGRTPLMKACRAGHVCTVKFLIQKGADVNRQTTNNDHTPLSLACAGGHQQVVELLLAHGPQGADPFHKLKDNSTMLIEAAKGGHTGVVQLLLDYPTSISTQQQQNQPIYIPAPMTHQPQINISQIKQQQQLKLLQQQQQQQQHLLAQQAQHLMVAPPGLHDVTEGGVIRLTEPPGMFHGCQPEMIPNQTFIIDPNNTQTPTESSILTQMKLLQSAGFKDGLAYGLTKAQSAVNQMVNQQTTPNNINVVPNNLGMTTSANKQKNISRKKSASGALIAESQAMLNNEVRSSGVGEEENVTYVKSSLEKLENTLQKNIQFINDSGPPSTLLPSGTYDIATTTPAQGKSPSSSTLTSVATSSKTTQNQITSKPTQITAKSEVSQSTAISDRPKAKPNSRKKLQQQKQQQLLQQQLQQASSSENAASQTPPPPSASTNATTNSSAILSDSKSSSNQNPSQTKSEDSNEKVDATEQEVPQTVPEASSTSDDQKDQQKAPENCSGARSCSLIDLETFQKMRLNNLSNRSVYWDPKVFRKIAQIIDPPKSPTETPPESSQSSRPNSPDVKSLANDVAEMTHILDYPQALQSFTADLTLLQGKFKREATSKEELEKTFAQFNDLNTDFICEGAYSSLEESLDSFNPDDLAIAVTGDDGQGQNCNNEWLDEVMQALNVSPDISNAFQEIAANISNHDLEQYANLIGLNQFCKKNWSIPPWPPTHQMQSENSSPEDDNSDNAVLKDANDMIEGADPNLLMAFNQPEYQTQFTAEQLLSISQLHHQSLLQIDPHTAQNILLPPGCNLSVPPPPIFSSTAPGQAQKSQVDAQQQTKFVFNVDNDKTSQSLQLLFQLPPDQQQNQQPQINNTLKQQQQQTQQPQVLKNVTDAAAQQQQKLAQTQTQSGQVQIPYTMINQNHQQNFISFQQQPQLIQQHPQQPQQQKVVPQVPKFLNKNLQQVQVATQTQMMGTQTPQSNEANQQQQQHATTSTKLSNMSLAKKTGAEMRKKSRSTFRQQATGQNQYQYDQQMQNYAIPGSTSTGTTTERAIEIDSETDSNHDTALTLACAGGHEELVELLLTRKANIEHRDKKGFTPLILAATAGHEKVVEILINAEADLEAQSERTKDTPLSLACSGGRYEVVELLLKYGANKEHRNVSDYTPLSLAASGGYVNIIKLLLTHGAEINSRTGSKLGISPLMLAAMNGHAGAVRLLLDMGSDINAQIETNRNTALTLACFQGRHEVVSLLLDRKANVEHRAKTGLTPLMEAASGGYIEVGRVLLDKGADVNAAPVPSSRDTALTIAADKGHLKFVELLLSRGAAVEVKNKKGNSPLWLAANGGHLNVVEALNNAKADIDSQDNRKVSCLMAAFRKGHVKVVRWMVNHVTQFPSDQEMTRFIQVVDREIVDKCKECVKIILAAKETQAAKANINASILLKELDMEKSREDARKAAAAKRREKKKKKKQEKREAHRKLTGDQDNQKNDKNQKGKGKGKRNDEPESEESEEEDSNEEEEEEENEEMENPPAITLDKEEGDSGIDQSSCSSSDAKGATSAKIEADNMQNNKNAKNQKRKNLKQQATTNNNAKSSTRSSTSPPPVPKESLKPTREDLKRIREQKNQRSADLTTKPKPLEKENVAPKETTIPSTASTTTSNKKNFENQNKTNNGQNTRKSTVFGNSRSSAQTMSDDYKIDYFEMTTASSTSTTNSKPKITTSPTKSTTVTEQQQPREEEWKAVGRKPTPANVTAPQPTTSTTSQPGPNEIGYKKIQVPSNAISRVIGRSGSNINAIRAATGAHIEVEKQSKQQGDRSITIKGVAEATKHAHNLISTLIKDPDADILSMLPRNNFQQPVKSSSSSSVTTTTTTAAINNGTSVWEKCLNTVPTFNNPIKPVPTVSKNAPAIAKPTTPTQQPVTKSAAATSQSRSSVSKNLFTPSNNIVRPTPGKPQDNLKKPIAANGQSNTKPITSSSMNASKISSNSSTTTTATSFAAKLSGSTAEHSAPITTLTSITETTMSSSTPTTITRSITPIGPPTKNMNASSHSSHIVNTLDLSTPYNTNASANDITSQIQSKLGELHVSAQLEYSLFDNYNINKWSNDKPISFNPLKSDTSYIPENESMSRVDASKAPGYRGASINSPVSSKTSSNSATPPSTILATQAPSSNQNQMQQGNSNYGNDYDVIKPIGQGPIQRPNSNVNNNMNYQRGFFEYGNNSHEYNSYVNPTMSRLNPKASSFSTNNQNQQQKMNSNQYGQSFMSNNNNFMKSPGSSSGQQSQNYQRSPGSSSSGTSRWCNEFGNYAGMEFSGSSPSMSPNNNNSQTAMNGPIDDSRKAPAPIGNERSYGKNYYGNNSGYGGYSLDMDNSGGGLMSQDIRRNSWMDKQQSQWPIQNMNARGPYDMPNDFAMQDIFQYQMDSTPQNNYMRGVNGQNYPQNSGGYIGNDLTNLAADLQAPTYEFDKQPWPAKWTH